MEDVTDEVIWQRVLAGDARAYGILWDRHRSAVLGHLVASGNQRVDADDLLAIAFLELWRRRRSIRFVEGSALPWLIVTARNVSRNASRARRRYQQLLAALPPSEAAPNPADEHQARDAAEHLLKVASAATKPADADLLALTALSGFSVKDAAQALGMSEAAARTRLSRLRGKLRAELETGRFR